MIDNVVLIDAFMHKFAIEGHRYSAALFFDFIAAFPSVSHNYIWACLRSAGIPDKVIKAIWKLYQNNQHHIKIGNKMFLGPLIAIGVRQGCPLSMIIFAICLEPFLKELHRIIGEDGKVGAYADDVAIVHSNISHILQPLCDLFRRFAAVSNLRLNHSKCNIVPLSATADYARFGTLLKMFSPDWNDFKISNCAEYLGFYLGPGSLSRQWDTPIKKAMDNCLKWRHVKAGFFFNILAVNIYIMSLFTFIGQLAKPNRKIDECFAHIRASLFSGPGNWVPQLFLEHLKELGFHTQVRDMKTAFFASRVRVALCTTLPLNDLAVEIGNIINRFNTTHEQTPHPHTDWHFNTFLFNITLAQKKNYEDYDTTTVEKCLQMPKEKRKALQKTIQAAILEKEEKDKLAIVIDKVRLRLDRWKLVDVLPGHRAQRVQRRLLHLKRHTKPAVVSAYFKTIFNGWPTQRRMRHLQGANTPTKCVFCNLKADCIEHFPSCSTVKGLFSKHRIQCSTLSQFLGMDMRSYPTQTVSIAKLHQILFKARQQFVHALQTSSSSPPPDILELIRTAETHAFR